MIEMNDTEVSQGDQQVMDENEQIFNTYIQTLHDQCGSICQDIHPDDIMEKFYKEFLNQPDMSSVEDRSIIIDGKLTPYDRDSLQIFRDKMVKIYEQVLGVICTSDVDIYHIYCLYQVFVTQFADYFLTYLCGLQKLDADFEEEIPNWEELSFENYRKKIGDESPISINTINNYIDYIVECGIYPNVYFDVCLYESSGNVALSELILESSSNYIQFDDEFIRLKFSKLLLSDEIKNYIADKLFTLVN